jgi:steroid delta-isomerase
MADAPRADAHYKAALQAYLDGLNARDADAVIALFAPDAVIEDPVGTPPKRGEAIAAWFRGAVQVEPLLELSAPIRGSHGASAAMAFTVTTTRKNGRFRTASVDVAYFNEDGLIERFEGHWGPSDRVELADD